MKNRFKILLSSLILITGLSGCYDEMDSKDSTESQFAKTDAPIVTMAKPSILTFSSIEVAGTVDAKADKILEVGAMVSTDNSFASYQVYPAAEVGKTFAFDIIGLEDNTTYYVRMYAVSAMNGTVVSASQTLSTPIAPLFDLNGVYAATEYDAKTGEKTGTYEVTIAFAEGSTTAVEITNFWDGGHTVKGTYDKTKGTVTIPTRQLISVHAQYGNVVMAGVNDAMGSYVNAITCKFVVKGGFLTTSIWAANVSAGNLGFFKVEMAHK